MATEQHDGDGVCIRAWEQALAQAGQAPLISCTDQGLQFNSPRIINAVQSAGLELTVDGRGRWMDNEFIERLSERHLYS
ncbi:MAG TPA: hypothetical protein VJA21_19930 [Verrucomicrobiae bacterium]